MIFIKIRLTSRTERRIKVEDEAKQKLIDAGVNFNAGMTRFMNKEDIYLKFLKRIEGDENFNLLRQKINEGNAKGAFEVAHTIKGVCANLSIDGINAVVDPMVEILRSGSLENVEQMMEEVDRIYEGVVQAIREVCG